jgi:SAM-dependent methyltransferase
MYAKHIPEPMACDRAMVACLLKLCQPRNALDLGCGLGYYVAFLREHGVDAVGVEAAAVGPHFKAPGYHLAYDLSTPFDLGKTFDLVLCLEVIEHIPATLEATVFDTITRHTGKYLLFSGSTPGQGGAGHVNEQPQSYWFDQLMKRGFQLLLEESLLLRSTSTIPWNIKNISLWQVTDQSPADRWESTIAAQQALSELALNRLHGLLFLAMNDLQTADQLLQATQARLHNAIQEIATLKSSRPWHVWLKLQKLKPFLPFLK